MHFKDNFFHLMPDGRLDKDLITDTARYDMLVRVGDVYVDVVIYSVLADNTLLYRSFPLPLTSAQSPVRALEEILAATSPST